MLYSNQLSQKPTLIFLLFFTKDFHIKVFRSANLVIILKKVYVNRESLSFLFYFRPNRCFQSFFQMMNLFLNRETAKIYKKKFKLLAGFVFKPILLNEKIAHDIQTNARANNENINVVVHVCENENYNSSNVKIKQKSIFFLKKSTVQLVLD